MLVDEGEDDVHHLAVVFGQRPLALAGGHRRARGNDGGVDGGEQHHRHREHDDIDHAQRREVQVDVGDELRPRQEDAGSLADEVPADGADDAIDERLRQEEHPDVRGIQPDRVVDGDFRLALEDGAQHRVQDDGAGNQQRYQQEGQSADGGAVALADVIDTWRRAARSRLAYLERLRAGDVELARVRDGQQLIHNRPKLDARRDLRGDAVGLPANCLAGVDGQHHQGGKVGVEDAVVRGILVRCGGHLRQVVAA